MINSKFKESLSELEKFKNQAILILEYKKRNYPLKEKFSIEVQN